MDENGIYDELINILKDHSKYPELLEKATLDTHIVNDLKVNSVRLIDVVLRCEDKYGISIDDDEVDKIRTIGDAMKIIKAKMH